MVQTPVRLRSEQGDRAAPSSLELPPSVVGPGISIRFDSEQRLECVTSSNRGGVRNDAISIELPTLKPTHSADLGQSLAQAGVGLAEGGLLLKRYLVVDLPTLRWRHVSNHPCEFRSSVPCVREDPTSPIQSEGEDSTALTPTKKVAGGSSAALQETRESNLRILRVVDQLRVGSWCGDSVVTKPCEIQLGMEGDTSDSLSGRATSRNLLEDPDRPQDGKDGRVSPEVHLVLRVVVLCERLDQEGANAFLAEAAHEALVTESGQRQLPGIGRSRSESS